MTAPPIAILLCTLLLFAGGASGAAATAQTVEIKLQDPSTESSIAHMRVLLDHETVKPGRITFHATNESRNLVHEVIVARDDGAKELPMDAKRDRVIESRVRRLGEIADVAPGKTGKLSLTLKAGAYVLFCNEPGHYLDGMVTRLTVAP
jgi:uncharacterized cupredoxin-like copper-binding protein